MTKESVGNLRLCAGCTACECTCPVKCIELKEDEMGNRFPHIDKSKCIDCGACNKVCPVISAPHAYSPRKGYITRIKQNDVLMSSNSGGLFTALARYILDNDGVVYGVGFDKDFNVVHIGITKDRENELSNVRGSKYVQSDLSGVFSEIREYLINGRSVCFSGTPCQVAGLKSFLGKEYDNLICVDLVCHGTSSPAYYMNYIEYMKKKYKAGIREIVFRNKTYGYHSGTMKIVFDNNKSYYGSGRVDPFLRAYYGGGIYREACYECPFKGIERFGDMTLFDSWHVNELTGRQVDDDKGFTNVYVNTEKGEEVIDCIRDAIDIYEADIESMMKKDGKMIDKSFRKAEYRDKLLIESRIDFSKSVKQCLEITWTDHLIEKCKCIVSKLKIYRFLSYRRR